MSGDLHRVGVGALDIACRLRGAGPPLVLFHGAEGDHQIYDRLQDELADQFTVISFDQRDCGQTVWRDPTDYDLSAVAADAVGLLDALGHGRAHVLGNSIGGVLAQIFATTWPERVDRLVLGLTWPADERLQDLNPTGIARRAEYVAMGPDGEALMADLMAGPGYLAAHPELLAELRSLRTEVTAEARSRRQAAFAAPVTIDPGRIAARTLLVGGEVDQMAPADVTARLAARIPNARFEVLPGAGHLAARQYPRELAQMIAAFLNS